MTGNPTSTPSLLRFEQVEFVYPGADGFRLRLDGVSVQPGEQVAVIGPSGCGKSTLLGLAAGILSASSGTVQLDGEDWSELPEAARRARRIRDIGLVFQEFELLEHLSARENILLPYLVSPALRQDTSVEARLSELGEAVGITALLGKKPRKLSQGERQRVALARALITSPRLVLADEPTGNLDPRNAGNVIDLLTREVERTGATLVIVTHDHGLLERFGRTIDMAELEGAGA